MEHIYDTYLPEADQISGQNRSDGDVSRTLSLPALYLELDPAQAGMRWYFKIYKHFFVS